MRWHDPSLVGEQIPWRLGLHKQPRDHSPGGERAVPVRLSLTWVREGREDKV